MNEELLKALHNQKWLKLFSLNSTVVKMSYMIFPNHQI